MHSSERRSQSHEVPVSTVRRPVPMPVERHCFSDLNTIIDRIHSLFEAWESRNHQCEREKDTLCRAKLAVHEWVANLIQHAAFGEHPEIWLELRARPRAIECVIEDNSDGFDLAGELNVRERILEAFPERGMGLLLLQACAEDLSYARNAAGRQRLAFRVADDQIRGVDIPF